MNNFLMMNWVRTQSCQVPLLHLDVRSRKSGGKRICSYVLLFSSSWLKWILLFLQSEQESYCIRECTELGLKGRKLSKCLLCKDASLVSWKNINYKMAPKILSKLSRCLLMSQVSGHVVNSRFQLTPNVAAVVDRANVTHFFPFIVKEC